VVAPVRRALIAALLASVGTAVAACSGPTPADLFVVTRSGSIRGAELRLRLTDDGGAYCNGGPRHEITSAQLIEARELRRELDGEDDEKGLAERGLRLRPGRVTTLSYHVLSEEGVVVFSDTSPHQPQAFYRLAKLTRDVARGACGLPR
jgi:hypothetical protein